MLNVFRIVLLLGMAGWASGAGERLLSGKRVLFVVFDRYHPLEYGVPEKRLKKRGASVVVASSSKKVLHAYHSREKLHPVLLLKKARMSEFDALVFIGGYRYESNNPETWRLVHEALRQGKPVAAICIAPVTLAKADVIRGKRVTASTRFRTLKKAKGIVLHRSVVRDGLLITANGPAAAEQFAGAIVDALENPGASVH